MSGAQITQVAKLRAVIGYLGEREHFAWWQSSFFGAGSKTFLAPIFGKNPVLAQCSGVTRSAALLHDERIGVGNVYHLFRLFEDMEQDIHQALHQPTLCVEIAALVIDRAAALAYLHEVVGAITSIGIGPTHVSDSQALRTSATWARVAAYYLNGFDQQIQVYPYFVAHL